MKKLLIFIAVTALFLGCDSSASNESTTETSATETAPASTDTTISTTDTLKARRPDQ